VEEKSASNNDEGVILPQLRFIKGPIKTSLGVLGNKSTIMIIRDIGFLKVNRFNRLLESIPGLTPLLDKIILHCISGLHTLVYCIPPNP
jgi:DNA-binding HxlR family transcriptional regulator